MMNISFVDIPGYGYANTPKNVKRSWETMVMTYLEHRKNIVCYVYSSRHTEEEWEDWTKQC